MDAAPADRSGRALVALRIGLAAFVLAWLFGPATLRVAIPIWVPFLIALGLEVHFFVGGLRANVPSPRRDGRPQEVDRERYGYAADTDDLVLVRRGGEELWIPYSGESEEELEEVDAAAQAEPERDEEEDADADPGEPRRRARPVGRLLVGLAVIAALGAVAWAVESRTGWNGVGGDAQAAAVDRFSAEASRIVGRPVTIRCDESGDYVGAVQHADGVAAVGGRLAFLTPERCYDLYRLAEKEEVSFSQTGRALAVLAHEAWHLRGVRDEGTTECYALQSGVDLGKRLGLAEGTARRMMRQQLAENALRAGASVEYRVPPECRDGGRLDLRPGDSAFP